MKTYLSLTSFLSLSLSCFKFFTPHGDGNQSINPSGKPFGATTNVLNFLPLTGMETWRSATVMPRSLLVLNFLPLTGMETCYDYFVAR